MRRSSSGSEGIAAAPEENPEEPAGLVGEWWLAGDSKPWQPDAVEVLSDKLVFRPRPRLVPVA